MAATGAIRRPSWNRSTAASSKSTSRARGTDAGRRARPSRVATQSAAAPSVSGELFAGRQSASAAAAVERRTEPRELLERRVRPRERVPRRAVERRDQVVEEARLLRRDRPLVAPERERVLLRAADLPLLRHLLAVLAHALPGGAVLDFGDVEAEVSRPERTSAAPSFLPSPRPWPIRRIPSETFCPRPIWTRLMLSTPPTSASPRWVAPRLQQSRGLERAGHARAALQDRRVARHVRFESRLQHTPRARGCCRRG